MSAAGTVLLSAGDASGDLYAADLVRALRERRPGVRFAGLGGAEMERAGVEIVVPQRELAVGGFGELVPDLHRVARAWHRMRGALTSLAPRLVVLVDSAGFNLPLARRARRAGAATLYYVCPQVWAWRRRRIRKLVRRSDRLAAILPFEPPVYRAAGARAEFVGHPLVDRFGDVGGGEGAAPGREAARARLGLPERGPWLALLPGSRRHELRHGLPVYLETAQRLQALRPELGFVLPVAPSLERGWVEARLGGRAAGLRLRLVDGGDAGSRAALAACDAALLKPGTATLEATLLGRPFAVAARASAPTAALLRRLLHIEWLALPNLIAGRPVVREFLQQEAEPERIAAALLSLLHGEERERTLRGLAEVRTRLGGGGAAQRVAGIAEELLDAAPGA